MKLECDVIRDLLPLYAEKLASPASSALVEQHLAACPACRAELEQMEKPVPVQPEPQPDAPLKNIRSSLNRRRLRTMLCSFAAALAPTARTSRSFWWIKTPPLRCTSVCTRWKSLTRMFSACGCLANYPLTASGRFLVIMPHGRG